MELIKQIDCAEAIYEALRTPMLKGTFTDTMNLAMSLVKEVPTIEAEPVKHGRWITSKMPVTGGIENKCSVCETPFYTAFRLEMNYCPNCGAKMDEE